MEFLLKFLLEKNIYLDTKVSDVAAASCVWWVLTSGPDESSSEALPQSGRVLCSHLPSESGR